jgi:hypothetical protein
VWAALTAVIYIVPFSWLANLSMYKAIGFEQAPSIGLTRAYWFLLHGKLHEAVAMNHLIFFVLAIGVPMLLYDVYVMAGRAISRRH